MEKRRILVVGSSNTDMVIQVQKFPVPGETILGGKFFMNPGGKGANQAVAASRLGGLVTFIGKIGDDIFGKQAVQLLEDEGINVDFVGADREQPSGVAMITVDASGENSIVVAPGSNSTLLPADFDRSGEEINGCDIVLMQLEIPIKTVEYIAKKVTALDKKVILNPAPAARLSDDLLKALSIITPNETEAELLTGIKVRDEASTRQAALKLKGKGVDIVIITLGKNGAFVLADDFTGQIPAPVVNAVDTTAAGDTFNGALAVGLSEGNTIQDAVQFACNAASISVMRLGAQSSIPSRNEL
ncbi:MAG: ribokinase [Chlorobi bacterium]|nr:ribokinase [Chlorobiota bacterium]